MAAIHWLDPINGSFANASDWAGGVVPGSSDDAILDAVGGGPYTVTASVSETVHSIQTASDATLSITAGTFAMSDGTGGGANAGTIVVGLQTILSSSGAVANTGVISFASGAHKQGAEWDLTGSTTLSGGGQVLLANNSLITAKKPEVALINVDDTISGAGQIGRTLFCLENEAGGVVLQTGPSTLQIKTEVLNNGLLEANGGELEIMAPAVVDSSSGTILAEAASVVFLYDTSVIGGTFRSVGSGEISARGGTLTSITNDAYLFVDDNEVLQGSITNNGTIATYGIGLNSLTLAGSGVLTVNADIQAQSDDRTLVNLGNTIIGVGTRDCDVSNAVTIVAAGGPLTLDGDVTGAGIAVVDNGTLRFLDAFSEDVVFTGKQGVLELAQSQDYTGTISGFSTRGRTTLELDDVGFVSTNEAVYSGNRRGGVLTVSDGVDTATIDLSGNYLSATFGVLSNGRGGVTVIAALNSPSAPPHGFVDAMAGLVRPAGEAVRNSAGAWAPDRMLAKPQMMTP